MLTINSTDKTALKVGDRIISTLIHPDSINAFYKGKVGTVLDPNPDGAHPLVRFTEETCGSNEWYVTEWVPIPKEGQRVTVTKVSDLARDEFREWAVGKSGTYQRYSGDGHTVKFDDAAPRWVGTNPANSWNVAEVEFTSSEDLPEREAPEERSLAIREREAQDKYNRLVEAINDLAEQEQWCGEFERWAEQHDVPVTRVCEQEYTVDVRLTYEIDSDTILEMFRNHFDGDHYNADVADATVRSDVSIIVTMGADETPHDLDGDVIESLLENDGYRGFTDWTITNYTANN